MKILNIIAISFFSACIIFVILAVLVWGIDSVFLTEKEGTAQVIHKEYIPAHTDTISTFHPAYEIFVDDIKHYDDVYLLELQIDSLKDKIEVEKKYFDSLPLNEKTKVKYTKGRLFKRRIFIRSLLFI